MKEGSHVALTRCFFCGEGKDILLHKRLGDISKYHDKVVDMEPCPKCAEHMKKGVILLEVEEETPTDTPTRTGRMWVVVDDFIKRLVKTPEVQEGILKRRMSYLPRCIAEQIGLPRE